MSIKNLFGNNAANHAECKELADKVAAVSQSQAVIEFDPQGNILNANPNFLSVMGYSLNDIVGRHHSLFVDDHTRNSAEYRNFWAELATGQSKVAEFKRVANGGREVWIHASYNPLKDENGRVYKVVKFATDLTEQKTVGMENQGYLNAIHRSQAVIEFNMDGTIITANENFLGAIGYRLDEIQGQHHRMFVEPEFAASTEYREFWEKLNRGEFEAKDYKRLAKGGREIWISASYNPIFDASGKPVKVVKFASDITEQKRQAVENQKNANISMALKLCQANVMLADNDLNIVYLNNTVEDMLRKNEADLQKSLSGFDVDKLVGTNVDIFHKNPSHQRKMLESLKEPFRTSIEVSGLTFGLIASPWFDAQGNRLGTLVEWEDKTERLAKEREEKKMAEENARVRQALDNVTANVMIADADAHIIYLNSAVSDMMNEAESDIKRALPNFDANNLVGANIDVFHKNPSHQRNLLKDLKGTYQGKAEVGGRTFTVIANPVFSEGERVGTVVEWSDKTAELAIEAEIRSIVDAAGAGDFSKQVALDGKDGFFLNLGRGLNDLISTVEVALNDILRMLGAMARGDLSERITREYDGAFGQLKSDANTTADKLTEIITKIRNSASAISSAANEIAQGNADLSQRTEEQASSLEETASSMEEMTSTVKQSADNAQQANTLAQDAQGKAQQGGEVVSNAVTAMQEINDASKKISDIIGVIDEIAFQTNLLALNAAVEAARAGEQGRGFAVVAGEVRNLAQRSAAAAKEIKDLIRDSVDKVEDGARLVNESGQTLSDIVNAVEEVTTMIREIAEAAREQTSGIEQVNTAITQMDEMTQQNAALVEEASAAGEAMADQARNMNQVVEFFSIGGGMAQESSAVVQRQSTSSKTSAVKANKNIASSDDEEWEDF